MIMTTYTVILSVLVEVGNYNLLKTHYLSGILIIILYIPSFSSKSYARLVLFFIFFQKLKLVRLGLAQGHPDSEGWSKKHNSEVHSLSSVPHICGRSRFSHCSVVSLAICAASLCVSSFPFDGSLPDALV